MTVWGYRLRTDCTYDQRTYSGFLITKNIQWIGLDLGDIPDTEKRVMEVGVRSTWQPQQPQQEPVTPKGAYFGGFIPRLETPNDIQGELVYS